MCVEDENNENRPAMAYLIFFKKEKTILKYKLSQSNYFYLGLTKKVLI